jgi:excinuclease UvrABC nuclease subunit
MKPLVYRRPSESKGSFLPWVGTLKNQSGVYVIRSIQTKEVLYVGESHTGNLGKTLKRHFFEWRDDPERTHNTYDARRVEVAIRLCPQKSAQGAQDRLIRRLQPRDNGTMPEKVERPF